MVIKHNTVRTNNNSRKPILPDATHQQLQQAHWAIRYQLQQAHWCISVHIVLSLGQSPSSVMHSLTLSLNNIYKYLT